VLTNHRQLDLEENWTAGFREKFSIYHGYIEAISLVNENPYFWLSRPIRWKIAFTPNLAQLILEDGRDIFFDNRW